MKKILIGALFALATVAHAATKVPVPMLDTTGSTSGQVIVSGGPSGTSSWGTVSVGGLAPIAANTVLANATGSTATPTAFAMPSCSGSNNALRWTSGTGFTCASSIALTSSGLNQFAATTSAQLAGVISDETGSGALVFGTNPTVSGPTITGGSVNNTPIGATTPNTGAFTTLSTTGAATVNSLSTGGASISGGTINGTSVGATTASTGRFTTLTATSTITPSSTAGIVGTATNDNANAGSVGEFVNPAATTGTNLANNTTTNCASASFAAGDWDIQGIVQFVPAGSTSLVNPSVGISTTSATFGTFDTAMQKIGTNGAGLGDTLVTPVVRESFSATTTVYLVASSGVATSTATCNGRIRGRRPR